MKQYVLAFILGVLLELVGQKIQNAYPMEGDDHGNHGPLKSWFDSLASKNGLCCSFADGVTISDVDWDTKCELVDGKEFVEQRCHYRVRLEGNWVDVPDDSVIYSPNKYGPAVVWPIYYDGKLSKIRCFMPGAGT